MRTSAGVSVLTALLLASCASQAQHDGTVPLSLEAIFRDRTSARSVTISPDGQWLAVSGRGADGAGIYLLPASAGPGDAPSFWVQGSSPDWAPDSRRIVYVAGGDIFVAERGSNEGRRIVTDLPGVRSPVFSPSGDQVAFYSTASGHQDIWLVAADGTGEPRQLTRESMAADNTRGDPAWSPDGRSIAYISNSADYWADDIWVSDVTTGEARQVSRRIMAQGSPAWSSDGSRIAVYGTAKDGFWYHDLLDIYIIDVASGVEKRLEMQALAAGSGPVWSEDDSFLFFLRMERGDYDVWTVPARGGVATRVTNIGGSMSSLGAPADGRLFVFVRSSPTAGSEVYRIDALGGEPVQVTRMSQRFAGLQEPREVSFRSHDGLFMQGFLYLPPNFDPNTRYPALVQVHGGGTNSYLRGENLIEQYLAARGYVVLAVNYRGGSGFGRVFQDLSYQDWLNGQARDAGAAADFLRSLPYTNGRVGIYGGSYGGMTSMGAITRTPDKFDAAVPMRGIYSAARTFDELDRVGKIFVLTGHGGFPDEQPEAYAVSDVLSRIDRIQVPVLLMHGEADARAPFTNQQLAAAEFERLGKEYEAVGYPGEGHGFRNPDNSIDMYRRLEAFFDRHLKQGGSR